jgi:glucokinase
VNPLSLDSVRPVFGVDLGGTYLRAAAADGSGNVLSERAEHVDNPTGQAFAARVRELADELCPEGPAAIAVGLPGPVAAGGLVGHLVNTPALNGAPIRSLLQEEFDVPVVIENDVNLAALGEQRRGRARGVQDVAFIAVGTGVGMGILVGGRVLRGAHGGAGELGLLPMAPDRTASDLRELGPLEVVAAGAGLAARWSAHTGQPASGRDVFTAAEAGDSVALALLDDQARALAMGVRAVQALLDPELFVFGGGMGMRHEVLARVQAALAAHGTPPPEVELSALGERAGLVGALEAAIDAAGEAQLAGVES